MSPNCRQQHWGQWATLWQGQTNRHRLSSTVTSSHTSPTCSHTLKKRSTRYHNHSLFSHLCFYFLFKSGSFLWLSMDTRVMFEGRFFLVLNSFFLIHKYYLLLSHIWEVDVYYPECTGARLLWIIQCNQNNLRDNIWLVCAFSFLFFFKAFTLTTWVNKHPSNISLCCNKLV